MVGGDIFAQRTKGDPVIHSGLYEGMSYLDVTKITRRYELWLDIRLYFLYCSLIAHHMPLNWLLRHPSTMPQVRVVTFIKVRHCNTLSMEAYILLLMFGMDSLLNVQTTVTVFSTCLVFLLHTLGRCSSAI